MATRSNVPPKPHLGFGTRIRKLGWKPRIKLIKGLKRVIPSIIKKLKISNITFNYENLIFKLDLRYLVDRRFYLLKDYDNSKIQLFNILINKFKISNFLDLGSCWGIYSLRIAKKNPKTQVLAFDVFEKNCSRLKEMREINNLNNIKIFSLALGDSKKEAQFSVDEVYSPNYAKDLNGKFKININQDKLDNILNIQNEKIAIKIDVERTEIEVLNGSKKILEKNNCFVQIEYLENLRIKIDNFFQKLNYNKIVYTKSDSNEAYFSNFLNQDDINSLN